jgi:hypothetical protein
MGVAWTMMQRHHYFDDFGGTGVEEEASEDANELSAKPNTAPL